MTWMRPMASSTALPRKAASSSEQLSTMSGMGCGAGACSEVESAAKTQHGLGFRIYGKEFVRGCQTRS